MREAGLCLVARRMANPAPGARQAQREVFWTLGEYDVVCAFSAADRDRILARVK
jgi:uncharacterized protein with GYD domain